MFLFVKYECVKVLNVCQTLIDDECTNVIDTL